MKAITLDGQPLTDYTLPLPAQPDRHRRTGAVPLSRSIRENITYGVGREVSDEEVFDAARPPSTTSSSAFPERLQHGGR